MGTFAKPLLSVWSAGPRVLQAIFETFSPLGVNLPSIRVEDGSKSPAEQAIVVQFSDRVTYRWRLERVELTLSRFTDEQLQQSSLILKASDQWMQRIGGELSFSSHHFSYFAHSTISGMSSQDFLMRLPHPELRSIGEDVGPGVIFHWQEASRGLNTTLLLEHSQAVPSGLFTMFSAVLAGGALDYASAILELRRHFEDLLAQLGLQLEGA